MRNQAAINANNFNNRIMRKSFKRISQLLFYLTLILVALVFLFPFFHTVMGSFKENSEIFTMNQRLLPEQGFSLRKYVKLFETIPFGRSMLNSFIHSGATTILVLFFSSLAGYTFARYPFPGKNILFATILLTMMIPFEIRLIPSFILIRNFNWLNTYKALIIPGAVEAFGIFLMRQYMSGGILNELADSAKIDGCSEFQIYSRIAVPVTMPGIVLLGVMTFMRRWNAFMWPFIVIGREKMMTVTLVMQRLADPRLGPDVDYGVVFAAATLAAFPIIVLFLMVQRRFIEGLMSGYMKG